MANNAAHPTKKSRLHLKALLPSSLPPHPKLSSLQEKSDPVDLSTFAYEVLAEAVEFTDSLVSPTFQKKGSPKKSPPSTATVQLLESNGVGGETWFARQSVHENAPLEGTASYPEFENGLFHDHSINEADYTPNVYHGHKVLDYAEQLQELGGSVGPENQFEEVAIEIFEMCHQIGGPLNNRVFATLVVRAKTRAEAFVVAQAPVDLSRVSDALYSNGRHRKEGDNPQKKEKVTIGQYTSVERVGGQSDGKIMWEMATASDAKGFLPMSLQKLGVPGAVVKDVGFFMKWANDNRGKA